MGMFDELYFATERWQQQALCREGHTLGRAVYQTKTLFNDSNLCRFAVTGDGMLGECEGGGWHGPECRERLIAETPPEGAWWFSAYAHCETCKPVVAYWTEDVPPHRKGESRYSKFQPWVEHNILVSPRLDVLLITHSGMSESRQESKTRLTGLGWWRIVPDGSQEYTSALIEIEEERRGR